MKTLTVSRKRGRPAAAPRLVKYGAALVDDRQKPLFLIAFAPDETIARERLAGRARGLVAAAADPEDRVLLQAWLSAFARQDNRPYWMVADGAELPRWSPEAEENK